MSEWLSTSGMPDAGLHGPITMESLLYVLGLQRAAELADFIGDASAADYRLCAGRVQAAIRANCMTSDGMIADGPGSDRISQHGQVFGVLTGTLSDEEGRRIGTLTEILEKPASDIYVVTSDDGTEHMIPAVPQI